jgi:aerobic-type carbon monoxide dehydrogenase small subunit (CoxS/CutS family)
VIDIRLTVNGSRHELRVEPLQTLAETLRGPVGLQGTKIACGEGTCGACTVLVDGVPTLSCILLAAQADGAQILTVEGLGHEGDLSDLQRAFIEEDAFQCGFCTPGQLLSAAALLEANPSPTRDEVRAAMSGNLCRCGAYVKIERAVLRAAAGRET